VYYENTIEEQHKETNRESKFQHGHIHYYNEAFS